MKQPQPWVILFHPAIFWPLLIALLVAFGGLDSAEQTVRSAPTPEPTFTAEQDDDWRYYEYHERDEPMPNGAGS